MGEMTMDIRKIRKLVQLLEKSQLAEIEVSAGQQGIRIKKSPSSIKPSNLPLPPSSNPSEEATSTGKQPTSIDNHQLTIHSELIGTFQASPAPDAECFVMVGDLVKKGDTLGIIKSLKMDFPLTAPINGQVLEIKINDQEVVDYGKELFVIQGVAETPT